jgi:O-antigen/teichoic acid export membrane protein
VPRLPTSSHGQGMTLTAPGDRCVARLIGESAPLEAWIRQAWSPRQIGAACCSRRLSHAHLTREVAAMLWKADAGPAGVTARGSGRLAQRVLSAARRQWSDPLSRGGLALLVNTGLTGVLGFGYWIIAARLFSTYAVGAAGALVSATTLFASIGQLNLSNMLMRFLPKAGGKSRRLVLSTYAYAAITSASLALMSLIAIRLFAAPNSRLRLDTVESAALVLAVAATAIFTIEDSVLVGLRRAVWVPVENGAFGVAKICILLALAPVGTAFALYGAWMIPLTLTIPVISIVIFGRFLPPAFKTRRTARLGRKTRSSIVRFTIGDATGNLFTQTWTYLLPVLIAASLGVSINALFFTSFLFSNTIDQVASNYASPLVVEGAHSPEEIAALIGAALRHIFAIILPTVAVLMIMSPWLLRAFGAKYINAAPLMCLLLTACIPKAVATIYYAYCRIYHTTHRSAMVQAYVCIATLSATMLLGRSFGLIGVGLAIVSVQSSAGAVSWLALRRGLRESQTRGNRRGRHRRPRDRGARNSIGIAATNSEGHLTPLCSTGSIVAGATMDAGKEVFRTRLGEESAFGRMDQSHNDKFLPTRRRP